MIKIKSSVDTSKVISKYAGLKKGYFILKSNAEYLSPEPAEDSVAESLIGSLKEITVRLSGTGVKMGKSREDINSKVSDFDFEMDMITMPENSRIARPSYDKKSTIRRTAGPLKFTDSFELPPHPKNNLKKTAK